MAATGQVADLSGSLVKTTSDLEATGRRYRPPRSGLARHGRLSRLAIHLFFIGVGVLFVTPLLVVVSASFSSESAIAQHGYSPIPREPTLAAYRFIFNQPQTIARAFGVSLFVTLVGSFLSLLFMAMLAWPLSRRDFKLRSPLSFFVLFTLLFNGGLVPFYIWMVNYLHQLNQVSALILPYLIIPFFVLILRTYFAGIPNELVEAARIDGAGEWKIFFRIVLPLSKPALATVGIFTVLAYWNDFLQALLFMNNAHLFPLQYLLYTTITDATAAINAAPGVVVPLQSVRMAMAVVATAPVLVAFVAVQRFFVRGATLGALKN